MPWFPILSRVNSDLFTLYVLLLSILLSILSLNKNNDLPNINSTISSVKRNNCLSTLPAM